MIIPWKSVGAVSIWSITTRYVLLALLVTVALSTASFLIYRNYLQQQHQQERSERVSQQADAIAKLLQIYQSVIDDRSRQRNLVDLILFSDHRRAETWARTVTPLLPHNIGLALLDEDGQLLGDARDLRIGENCRADIARMFTGESVLNPPVHRGYQPLKHFDLTAPLEEGGKLVGMVFASFSLTLIQEELDRIADPGQHLQLLAHDGYLIAEINRLDSESKQLFEVQQQVGDSHWLLQAKVQEQDIGVLSRQLGLTNVGFLIFIGFMLVFFARRLFRVFAGDFSSIERLLASLVTRKPAPEDKPQLKETERIFSNIQRLAGDIQDYQQQLLLSSTTDELSGLHNRRAFNLEARKFLQLAHRGMEVSLVLIDIDNFKPMNDSMGHASGDRVIELIGSCIQANTRNIDFSARIGGDEFAIFLANCSSKYVLSWYEKLADEFLRIQKQELQLPADVRYCSLSAGFAQIGKEHRDVTDLQSAADAALYAAKQAGRAQVRQHRSA